MDHGSYFYFGLVKYIFGENKCRLKTILSYGIIIIGLATLGHISSAYALAQNIWTIEAIDTSGDVGKFSSIATDSSGGVHIAYRDSDNYRVKYASNASGSWVIETPPEASTISEGACISIAVDSSNGIHISHSGGGPPTYPGCLPGYLFYTKKISDSWEASQPFSAFSDRYTSLAIDSADKEAVNDAENVAVLLIAEGVYDEAIALTKPKMVTLQGGWDASFENQTGTTILRQAPKVPKGRVTFQELRIAPN